MRARLLSHFGRQAWVLDPHGQTRLCVYKGRDLSPTANDWVEIDTSAFPAVVTQVHPRSNAVLRSESHRAKLLAANVDQAAIVIAGSPLFSDELLARMICACAAEGIAGIVMLNKCDRIDDSQRAREQLAPFQPALKALGWQVLSIAAHPDALAGQPQACPQGIEPLRDQLRGKVTVIMGQSGMGKSSVINALVPGVNAQTREISEALQTGKHTTTAGLVVAMPDRLKASPHHPDDQAETSWLVDTPGFQLFGLHHLSVSELALGFPEWAQIHDRHGRCRFNNCTHQQEPGCTVVQACTQDAMAQRRLALWRTLLTGLSPRGQPAQ